jgi:hypothetical protein
VLAAVASTAGVVYQIWPQHHFRATMSVREIKLDVSRKDYLLDVGADPPYSRKQGSGARFLLRAQVEGVDRSKLRLVSYMYASASDQPVLHWVEPDAEIFSPGAAISNQFGRAWVPFPDSPGDYYGRFELYAGDALIAYANSGTFSLRPS